MKEKPQSEKHRPIMSKYDIFFVRRAKNAPHALSRNLCWTATGKYRNQNSRKEWTRKSLFQSKSIKSMELVVIVLGTSSETSKLFRLFSDAINYISAVWLCLLFSGISLISKWEFAKFSQFTKVMEKNMPNKANEAKRFRSLLGCEADKLFTWLCFNDTAAAFKFQIIY